MWHTDNAALHYIFGVKTNRVLCCPPSSILEQVRHTQCVRIPVFLFFFPILKIVPSCLASCVFFPNSVFFHSLAHLSFSLPHSTCSSSLVLLVFSPFLPLVFISSLHVTPPSFHVAPSWSVSTTLSATVSYHLPPSCHLQCRLMSHLSMFLVFVLLCFALLF